MKILFMCPNLWLWQWIDQMHPQKNLQSHHQQEWNIGRCRLLKTFVVAANPSPNLLNLKVGIQTMDTAEVKGMTALLDSGVTGLFIDSNLWLLRSSWHICWHTLPLCTMWIGLWMRRLNLQCFRPHPVLSKPFRACCICSYKPGKA